MGHVDWQPELHAPFSACQLNIPVNKTYQNIFFGAQALVS